jgi:hypothetical protein
MKDLRHPVYIIAHNPNSPEEAEKVLALGVNGLEPDIHYDPRTRDLCISHSAPGENDEPPSVPAYLRYVKSRLAQYPGLSLMLFDIKLEGEFYNEVPIADWGMRLHEMANDILGDENLAIIYSVSKTSQCGIFKKLGNALGTKEGLMIDQESEVDDVIDALQPYISKGLRNTCYMDGRYAYLPDIGMPANIKKAIERRSSTGLPRFVGAWVLYLESTIREYFKMGVDGMLVTDSSIKTAREVVASEQFAGALRLAERNDNPFENDVCRSADQSMPA